VPLVLYGLASGILAVAAGALVPPSLTLATVAVIAVVASLVGDWLLSWLLPAANRSDHVRYS
jgi:hypothetical protein